MARLIMSTVVVLIFITATLAKDESNDACNNRNIAFVSERTGSLNVYLMDIKQLNPMILTGEMPDDSYGAHFSPDGTHLVFTSGLFYGDLYIMDLATREVLQLTNSEADEKYPQWSPDGSWIAYSSDIDGDDEIYILEVNDPNNIIQLTDNEFDDLDAAWSPDGDWIVYSSNSDGYLEIYVMEANNPENTVQLTDNELNDIDAAWSPDGDRIVFSSGQNSPPRYDIFIMNSDGSDVHQLVSSNFVDSQPAWSPDGQQIAFYSDRRGNGDVFLINADGSNLRQLTLHTHYDGHPVWQPVLCDEHSEHEVTE